MHVFPGASGEGVGPGRAAGDVDGDAFNDLIVGHYTSSTGAFSAGKITIRSGDTGDVLRTITSTTTGEQLGFDAVGVGDVNGDGEIDYLISAASQNRVYLISGRIPPPASPILAPSPHNVLKNRYISVDVRGQDASNPSVLNVKLTLTSTLVNGTTGPAVGSEWWANAPDGNCISLVGLTQPANAPSWVACDVVHLTGCAIIPTSTYDIIVIDERGAPSVALAAATQSQPGESKWWGDAIGSFTGATGIPPNVWTGPQGVTNFEDVTAALKTFQDPGADNATHTSITDIHPNRPDLGGLSVHPNKLVSIDDVFQFIKAFQGDEYPGGDLAGCTDP